MAEQAQKCEHDNCLCELRTERVVREGHGYCSEGCADGEGCTHAHCNCAEHSAG